ncbi:unnamed protein product [Notodromas monacha]|uniref:Phosphatidic acid phosphatase type 2/haloperoxidase domain-containing protein n=1 Tax=Notodromas monacha TaxID=399045 RepID=A0A7R9BP94_9CRUS|nr:unnamed protein product [Notodromas monacha]CAG0918077.1 unnamed protein product [Notodromas monacha]
MLQSSQSSFGVGGVACRVIIDFCILLAIGGVILYYGVWGEPRNTGFFCYDPTLSHPYRESSVPSAWLYSAGVFLPFIFVAMTELSRTRRSGGNITAFLADLYAHFVIWYGFGALVSQAVTYVLKFYVSRLRPHFFAVCKPDYTAFASLCETDSFILDYNCTNTDYSASVLREAYQSFPSGHSSFGFHAAAFLCLYLRERWRKNAGGIVWRPFIQFVFLTAAMIVGISRVNDFKHFPSDVVSGALLGALVALFVYFTIDLSGLRNHYLFDIQESRSSLTRSYPKEPDRMPRNTSQVGLMGTRRIDSNYKTFDCYADSLQDE